MKAMKNTEYASAIGRSIMIAAVAALSFVWGRAADTPASPAERVAKLESAKAEIGLTRRNIVLTLEQLDQVRHVEDPHAQFPKFVAQLANMKERAKLTQERAQLMNK